MKYLFISFLFLLFAFQNPNKGRKANKNIYDSVFVIGDIVKIPTVPSMTCQRDGQYHQNQKDSLNIIANFLIRNPDLRVEFAVHTDFRGSFEMNIKLSQGLANAYCSYLIQEKQIDSLRLIPKGYGESQQIVAEAEILKMKNITKQEFEAINAQNRRNELAVTKVN